MRKLTNMRFFQIVEYSSLSDANMQLLKDSYEEFETSIRTESETTNNLIAYCNQLIQAKVELQSLRKDKQIKLINNYIPIKAFYYKAQKQVDEQLKLAKWRMRCDYKNPTEQKPLNKIKTKIKWTGTPSELVELGYAFYATKTFNNGEIEIKELMLFLFSTFSFDVKNYYHKYTTIRKRTSTRERTNFLDKLKRFLIRKMDDDDNRKQQRE